LIGTGDLNGGVASIPISNLSAGTHSITAQYQGSSQFNPSTSSAVSQQVGQ
jgi:hypothetical protein